jgi:hypothetical protein
MVTYGLFLLGGMVIGWPPVAEEVTAFWPLGVSSVGIGVSTIIVPGWVPLGWMVIVTGALIGLPLCGL